MSKLITVFGATGNQGGSVIKQILAHPGLSKTYKIRAVTRDAKKAAAVKLANEGCDVFAANLDNYESVLQAVKGSDVVFGVTNFWEKLSPAVEIQQGKHIADASKASGVSHLIWSSLPYVSKRTNGELTGVKHFDSKASVEEYIRDQGIPATFVLPGGFMSTQLESFRPSNDTPPVYSAAVPYSTTQTKVPLHSAEDDTGLYVSAAIINGPEGRRIPAASGEYTLKELADTYEKVTGRKTQVQQIPYEVFESFLPPPIKEEISANMLLMDKYGYFVGEDASALERSRAYLEKAGVKKPLSWEEYVKLHVN